MTLKPLSELWKRRHFHKSMMNAAMEKTRRSRNTRIFSSGSKPSRGRELFAEALEPRILMSAAPGPPPNPAVDPVPTVQVQTNQPGTHPGSENLAVGSQVKEEMIGETFHFDVRFDNTGADTGYAPYIDVITQGGVKIGDPTGETNDAELFGSDVSSGLVEIAEVVEFSTVDADANGYVAGVNAFWDAIYNEAAANGGTVNLWTRPGADVTSSTFDFTINPPLADGVGVGPGTDYPGEFVEHPILAPHGAPTAFLDANDFNDGDTYYTLQLPFGSFTAAQPAKVVTFAATMAPGTGNQDTDTDHYVSVGETVSIAAMGGFAFGATPGATDDLPICGAESTDTMTATILEVKKDILNNAHENAAGPNDILTYTIDVDIAKDQTITNLVIEDEIPPGLIYVPNSVTVTLPNGAVATGVVTIEQPNEANPGSFYADDPILGSIQGTLSHMAANEEPNAAGGTLRIVFAEIRGSSDEDDFPHFAEGRGVGRGGEDDGFWDIHIEFEAYAAEFDANGDPVLNPNPGGVGAGTAALNDPGINILNSTQGVGEFSIDPDNDGVGVDSGSGILDNDDTVDGTVDSGEPVDADIASAQIDPLTIDKGIVNNYRSDGTAGNGTNNLVPGDLVEYRLRVEVSDYFGFDDLSIEEYIEDGLSLIDSNYLAANPGIGGALDLTPKIAYVDATGAGTGFIVSANGEHTFDYATAMNNFDPTTEVQNLLPTDPGAPLLPNGNDVTTETPRFSGGDFYSWDISTLGAFNGALYDGGNTTNGGSVSGPLNPNAASGTRGYFWYYDAQTVDPATGLPTAVTTLNEDVGGKSQIELRFFAQVQDSYEFTEVATDPNGDTGVSLSDRLWNYTFVNGTMQIDADVDGTADEEEAYRDGGRQDVRLNRPSIEKNIFAINQDTFYDGPGANNAVDNVNNRDGSAGSDGSIDDPAIRIGDTITYRLTASFPFGSAEDVVISDFLPLPVFDVDDYSSVVKGADFGVDGTDADLVASDISSGVLSWQFGPSNNLGGLTANPTVTTNSGANSVTFNFGTATTSDDNDPANDVITVDLLLSVQVNTQPSPDGLFLTNEVQLTIDETETEIFSDGEIVNVEVLQPDLKIRKGVLAVNPQGSSNTVNYLDLAAGQGDTVNGVGPDLSDTHTGRNHQWASFGETDHNSTFNSVKGTVEGQTIDISVTDTSGNFLAANTADREISGELISQMQMQSEGGNRGAFNLFGNTRLDQVQNGNGNNGGNDNTEWVVPGSVQIFAIQNSINLPKDDGSTHNDWAATATNAAGNTFSDPSGVGHVILDGATGNALVLVDVPAADGITGNIVDSAGAVYATINYETGHILSAGVSRPSRLGPLEYFPEGNLRLYANYDIAEVIDQNYAFEAGALAPATATLAALPDPGSVIITITENGVGPATDTITDDANGNLIQGSTGAVIGNVNYLTGGYSFIYDNGTFGSGTHTSSVTYNVASAAQGPEVGPAVIVSDYARFAGSVGTINLVPGTVRVSIDDPTEQVILVDQPQGGPAPAADALSGTLYELDRTTGATTAVGTITYTTGEIRFQVATSAASSGANGDIKIDFDEYQASEHYLTSHYLHGVTEFTAETQLDNWAAYVDSDVRGVDAGDVVTFGVFVENVGGGVAHGIEIFDSVFLDAWQAQVESGNAAQMDDETLDASFFETLDGTALTGTNLQTLLDAVNFKIYRGDGTLLVAGTDYDITFNDSAGIDYSALANTGDGSAVNNDNAFFQLNFRDGVVLEAGRNGGEIISNNTGSNIFMITYDLVIDEDEGRWGRNLTNQAVLTGFKANALGDNKITSADGVLRETADVQITGGRLNKVLIATDQDHTGTTEVTDFSNPANEGVEWETVINKSDFSDIDDLTLNGDAIQHDYLDNTNADGSIRNGNPDQALYTGTETFIKLSERGGDFRGTFGSAFFNEKQSIAGDFEIETTFTIHDDGGQIEEGIAMVFHNDPRGAAALGADGSEVGFAGPAADRIQDAFVIEYRTDGANSFLRIHENDGTTATRPVNQYVPTFVDTSHGGGGDYGSGGATGPVDEDTRYTMKVTYDASSQVMTVVLTDEYGHQFTVNHTVDEGVADIVGGDEAFVGFTASNSDSTAGNNTAGYYLSGVTMKTALGKDQHTDEATPQNVSTQYREASNDDDPNGTNGVNFNTNNGARSQNTDIHEGVDVAIGEEVIFGILVNLPEGLTPNVAVYDSLPDGLEFLDWELVTDPAAGVFGGNATAQQIFDASGHTDTPFTRAYGGGAIPAPVVEVETAPGVYTAFTAGQTPVGSGTGAIRFLFDDITNRPDDGNGVTTDTSVDGAQLQDDDPNDPSDQALAETNNTFMIAVKARVTNGADTIDYSGDGGRGIIAGGAGTDLDQSVTEQVLSDSDALLNTTYMRFAGNSFGVSNTAVSLEVVEPQLEIEKTVYNRTSQLLDNDTDQNVGSTSGGPFDPIAQADANGAADNGTHDDELAKLGDTITYRFEIKHGATSTADAFNVNLFDDLNASLGAKDLGLISEVRLINPPSYIGAGTAVNALDIPDSGAAPNAAITAGAAVQEYTLYSAGVAAATVTGMHDARTAGVNDSWNTHFATDLAADRLNLNFDTVKLGDTIIIELDVVIGNDETLAVVNAQADDDPDATLTPDRTGAAGDQIDVINEASLTWYSVDENSRWEAAGNQNEEAREYSASDFAYLAILEPDLDLNLAKGVLAVNTQAPGGQVYVADSTNNTNSGTTTGTDPWAWFGHEDHLGNPFHNGSNPVAGDGENSLLPVIGTGANAPANGVAGFLNPQGNLASASETLTDLVDSPADQVGGAANTYTATLSGAGAAVSATQPVVARTVEVQVQSRLNAHYVTQDPANFTAEVMILRDIGGANKAANEGYLYLVGIDTTGDGIPDQPGDETHTPVGFVNYDTGGITIDQALYGNEQERVELDYEYRRDRTQHDNDPLTAGDQISFPDEHDLINGRATVTGELASTGTDTARNLISGENGDITEGSFNVTDDQADTSVDPLTRNNPITRIESGSVTAHIYDRHGEIRLTDDGSGGWNAPVDSSGNSLAGIVDLDAGGTNALDYTWAGGTYQFETVERHSVSVSYSQVPATHPSGARVNITSDYLHNGGITTNANGSLSGITDWNGFVDRDILNTDPVSGSSGLGVDAGDVITFGIFVENLGSDDVYDLRIDDTIFGDDWDIASLVGDATATGGTVESWASAAFDSVGNANPAGNGNSLGLPAAGLVDVTASLRASLNLNITRGDGAAVAFSAFYNATSGAIEFEIGADGVHNGATADNDGFALSGGRSSAGGNLDNATGSNVLVITYDIELSDNFKALDRVTNVAEVSEYSYRDGGVDNGSNVIGGDRNADRTVPATSNKETQGLRDEAVIEGRSIEVNKILLATDQTHTDSAQHNAAAGHGYDPATDTQTVPDDSGTDVTIGEEIVYGIIVDVPEGSVDNFRITDQLPTGLEFIDARLIRNGADIASAGSVFGSDALSNPLYTVEELQASSAQTSTELDFRASRGGVTNYIGGDAATGGSLAIDVANSSAPGNTGALVFAFSNFVNAHDAIQDDPTVGARDTLIGHEVAGTSPIELPTNEASSERNNRFLLEIRARVVNGLDDIDTILANTGAAVVTAGSGADIAVTGMEGLNDGIAGTTLQNTAGVVFTEGSDFDQSGAVNEVTVASRTTVTVDVVEPELAVTKFVSNGGDTSFQGFYGLNDDGVVVTLDDGTPFGGGGDTNGDGTANDFTIAGLGQQIIYRVEMEHSANSTADAFDVRIFDTIDQMAATGFGTIVPGSVQAVDAVTGTPIVAGVVDNSTGSQVDIELETLAIGQRIAVEFIVQLGSDASLLLERGGPDAIDIENTVAVDYFSITARDTVDLANPGNDHAERRGRVATDTAEVSIVGPDLYINKNDGVQDREVDEVFDYTLTFGNKTQFNSNPLGSLLPASTSGFSEGVSPATGAVVRDTLPPELEFVSASSSLPGGLTFVGAQLGANPSVGDYSVDGQEVKVFAGDLNPGDQFDVVITVRVISGGESLINNASISSAFSDVFLLDNETIDTDNLSPGLTGGGEIFQGFRFLDSFAQQPQEEEENEMLPILTLMPVYSGTADPGTVLRIRIMGDTGAPLNNGDQTIVADAGGNWLATFPGLVLMDEPHTIIVEQTPPTWSLGDNNHGFNMRTYFAPAINPTHSQVEHAQVDDVLGRRLGSVVLGSIQDQSEDGATGSNLDWRLSDYELLAKSSVGGITE